MELLNFQLNAISELIEAVENEHKEIVFKSPTGSGKTIILTNFISEFGKGHTKQVFVWLSPGTGNLEMQSMAKMNKYLPQIQTKTLIDIMNDGFEENDACYVNWEKLINKTNVVTRESEKKNFQELVSEAHSEGLEFIVLIDEAHQNDTVKAADVINLLKPKVIIRTSATPHLYQNAKLIEVDEIDVINEGLIKKMLIINEDFGHKVEVNNQVEFLLNKAIEKQLELKKLFREHSTDVNPLIIVQIPNNDDVLLDEVERYFIDQEITYENNLLAVWLADKKMNLEDIEENNSEPIVIIIKQAVATGWDCPRAQILVKLRENTNETFEIQTIGRIRRMPEIKHYDNDVLDSCYLYTLDEKYTESVKINLGKNALDAYKVFLKEEYKDLTLTTEFKTDIPISKNPLVALESLVEYYKKTYNTGKNFEENLQRLKAKGYVFNDKIVKRTFAGNTISVNKKSFDSLEKIEILEPLNTHRHGREYHNRVGQLGMKLGLSYDYMNTIIRKLFDSGSKFNNKILKLETRDVYSFVINNLKLLKLDFRNAMSDNYLNQLTLKLPEVTVSKIKFPAEQLFTYNSTNRVQKIYENNVYSNYLSSAEIRSDPEKTFEKYCSNSTNVEWFYKNGDKGSEYLSIVYVDNFNNQKSFYPDYVLSVKNEIWIIETKGGFAKNGDSQDIDKFSPKKFNVLKSYAERYDLNFGFVRKDMNNGELFICRSTYNDDINSDSWELISVVF